MEVSAILSGMDRQQTLCEERRCWLLAGVVCLAIVHPVNAVQEPTFTPEPFRHLSNEFQQRRVIALADFAHENAYPFQTVLQTLNHWLQDPNQAGHSLTLGLEADIALVNLIQAYISTGVWQPLSEYLLPFTSLERLEFYHDLRVFYLDLERLNAARDPALRMEFRLAGFEPISLLSYFNKLNATGIADVQAALKGREKAIAQQVLGYVDEHPSERLLLFYGSDHLRKQPSKTSYLNRLFGDKENHYYIAHFLSARLGRQFFTVAQAPYPRFLRGPGHAERHLTGRDLFFKSSDVPWRMAQVNPADFDAVIFLHSEQIDEPHYLRFICSRRVYEQARNKMLLLESQRSPTCTAILQTNSGIAPILDG